MPKAFGYYNEDYHLLQATKAEPLHRLLRNQMTEARIPIEFSKGEAANGQHEVNIRYDHVLESADRTRDLQARREGDRLPQRLGHHVHGQAGPPLDRVVGPPPHEPRGTSTTDRPLMHAANGEKPGPYGLSEQGAQFIAGMMALSRELAVFIAPFINSYKRYAALSWAPVNVVWGRDNRTTGFRLVGHGDGAPRREPLPGRRHERVPDVRGDDRRRPVRDRARADAARPSTRATATSRPACRGCRGRCGSRSASWSGPRRRGEIFGDDVVAHYLNAARVEQELYDSVVHNWDRERYLERG